MKFLLENNILELILRLFEIIFLLTNVFIAYFLLKEARKMRDLSSSSNLVFSFISLSSYSIIGRLENIGFGTAYNIKVKVEPDFKIMNEKSLEEIFKNVKYLAPKQSYDINYGYINIDDDLSGFSKHKLTVSWTNTIKNKSPKYFIVDFSKDYFKSYPYIKTIEDLIESIDNIGYQLKSRRNSF